MNTSKFIGSTMILIGSIIGAGMLALPTVSAAAGSTWATILMLASWLISMTSGLLILEVNLALPVHACTFSSMAKYTLGNFGKAVTWLSYLFLLYAIITAYVIGGSNTTTSTMGSLLHLEIPTWLSATLFTVIFGIAVFWSTAAVDHFNRILISLKGVLLIATLAFIVPHIDVVKLMATPQLAQTKYLLFAIPAFLSAFCYHFVIPSLRIYIGDKPLQLRTIIIVGTSISLLIYLWWLAASLGIIPLIGDHSFTTIVHDPKPPSLLIEAIAFLVNNKLVTACIRGFANIALTSSFLCVALGLFDFLADGFRRANNKLGRLQTAGLTFIPPLFFAIFYPQGFIIAINYASISVAILAFVLPALMVYRLRQNPEQSSPYRVKCGNLVIGLTFLTGIVAIVVSIMAVLHLLPTLN